MLQRRKKYKNRTILGYKTLAEGVIRMDQVRWLVIMFIGLTTVIKIVFKYNLFIFFKVERSDLCLHYMYVCMYVCKNTVVSGNA